MPTRRSRNVIFCSLLACTTTVYAQLPVRPAEPPRTLFMWTAAPSTPPAPSLRYVLHLPPTMVGTPMPLTTYTTVSPLSWPSLDGSIVRTVRFRPLELGPGLDDRLWTMQPDGGLVHWVGTVMEYEAPAWEVR